MVLDLNKDSEIDVMATMSEPYLLDDIHLREVSFDKTFGRLYIKLQGVNNKSTETEQIKIYLNKHDSEALAVGINEAIKQGLFR